MPRIGGHLDIVQVNDPGTPVAGRQHLYFKSDGILYTKKPDGSVVAIGTGAAPTNMVTIDTSQTISGVKTLSVFASASGESNQALVVETSAVANSTTMTRDSPSIFFQGRYWDGTASTNTFSASLWLDVLVPSGLASSVRLMTNRSFGAAALYDNASRVYSPSNLVPLTGLTATGTTDATTFLRGDNTFAVPVSTVPANMVTTDTTQSITGNKTFRGTYVDLFPSTAASAVSPLIDRSLDFYSLYWNGTSSISDQATFSLTRSTTSPGGHRFVSNVSLESLLTVLGKTGVYDGASTAAANRVYSAANPVPIAGLSATGTKDATTFLRGDNTFATPVAPTNMVTTDTTQTITALKTFGEGGRFTVSTDASSMVVTETSSVGATVTDLFLIRDAGLNSVLNIKRSGSHQIWGRAGAADVLEFRPSQSSVVAHVATSGAIYDGAGTTSRVYSPNNPPPASTLTVSSVTAAHAAVAGTVVLANGTFTVTLPTPLSGSQITVKNIGTGVITIAGTVDGTTTTLLSTQYQSLTVVSDGTAYYNI